MPYKFQKKRQQRKAKYHKRIESLRSHDDKCREKPQKTMPECARRSDEEGCYEFSNNAIDKITEASFHQGAIIFEYGGMQCCAMCIAALCHSTRKPFQKWSTARARARA